jgi:mRNA deadenylase 3'-5' endonuclease subunit Ccr4
MESTLCLNLPNKHKIIKLHFGCLIQLLHDFKIPFWKRKTIAKIKIINKKIQKINKKIQKKWARLIQYTLQTLYQ